MRKITYKSLSIRNFLSVGNEEIRIDFQNGLNLITGQNKDNPERKNAVGKSAVIDAFYFALFGTTIREIKQAFIVNNVTKGNGNVTLSFDVETGEGIQSYEIKRQVKPSKVELWKGEEDITKDSMANTNKFINKLIGSNSTICKSCDILSLSDNVPFMAKKADEKRKFIEDIFALEIYGLMTKDLKDLIKDLKGDISVSTTRLEEIQKSIDSIAKQKEDLQKKIEEREEVLKQRKDVILNKIENANKELSSLVVLDVSIFDANIKKLSDAQKKNDDECYDLRLTIQQNKRDQKTLQDEIRSYDLGDVVKCDKCFQDIPHTHKEVLEKQKEELRQKIDLLKETLEKDEIILEDKVRKNDKILNALLDQTEKKEKIEKTIDRKKTLENLLEEYKESLENLEKDSEDNSNSVSQFLNNNEVANEERRKEESEKMAELKQKADDLETCKFILGDEGVKSFAVKKLLGMLNSSIQNYITELGMGMRCKFDEYFDEAITNEKGTEVSYWNFSGAERRTVDLACAWAFKDIKRKLSGVSSNVEFCDEIFDSGFDERGFDLLIEVLKGRIEVGKLSIYAVSHRKETIKHIEGEIVNLVKENSVTRRVDSDD